MTTDTCAKQPVTGLPSGQFAPESNKILMFVCKKVSHKAVTSQRLIVLIVVTSGRE